MRVKGEKTVLTKAQSKSESLRTTVPANIVRQFGLKEKDALYWNLTAHKNELIITVRVDKR